MDRGASSADFDEFQTVKSSKRKRPRRPQIKEFMETDRIDTPTHVASEPSGNTGDHFVFEVIRHIICLFDVAQLNLHQKYI